jgi:hypothetical protein
MTETARTATVDQAQDCLTVAASGAITDYTDVLVRGYLKEHPANVIYRLDLLTTMLAAVRERAHEEIAAGSWGPDSEQVGLDPDRDHHEMVAEYREHTCNCEWCTHAASEIPDQDPWDGS